MAPFFTLVSLFVLAASRAALASSCIAFDADFNLLAFGLNGKDYNAGTQDTWTGSNKASDITTSGRPPFDGPNPTCYLSQFTNAIYAMGVDQSKPSSVYIYDATAKSWSTQDTTTGAFDPSSFNAILDHDTNVFYALSHGELFFLDMGALKAANSTALKWTDVGQAPFPRDYQPVMALAQNHIHFLNVPDVPAGSANIFVIHFSFFQPEPQAYPGTNGNSFPATNGQTASFFQKSGVQQEFAFIPDDGSATYVVNVENNSTHVLAGPSSKDPKASYFAGITSLVQLDSTGAISFIPYTQGNTASFASSKWSAIKPLAAVAPASPTGGAGGIATKSGASPSGTGASSPGGNQASTGISERQVTGTSIFLVMLGLLVLLY